MLVVAAALIDTRGRILLAQRKADGHMANKWEFPGGKVRLYLAGRALCLKLYTLGNFTMPEYVCY